MTENDKFLWAWKQSGMPVTRIASKLNMTVEQVERRFKLLEIETEVAKSRWEDGSPRANLLEAFNCMAFQYQVLGENLKMMGNMLSQFADVVDVDDVINSKTDNDHVAARLLKRFIILKPLPLTEEKEIEDALKN